ncbi:MAG: ABC transporter permease [Candidatus Thermoplasmatota archaeon]|jgi:ABC-type dipeptide/oligopeptide/nickel transport system permease subunit|nr:ABC transporter permease [Candidatus Thermoplasmatota archaeon]
MKGPGIHHPWIESLKDLLSRRAFVAGLVLLGFYVFVALISALIYPRELTSMPLDKNLLASCGLPQGPTLTLFPFSLGDHPLGQTAFLGLGVAQGLIVGTRWDLFLIASVVVPSALVGIFLGLIAGTYGGRLDWFVMTVTDALLSIPYFVFVLLLVYVLLPKVGTSQGPLLFILSMILVMWAPFARGVRSEALRNSSLSYVEAARASGAGTPHIIARHILPNSITPSLAQLPVAVTLTLALIIGTQYITYYDNSHAYGVGCTFNSATSLAAPVVPTFTYPEWGGVLGAGITYTGAWLPQPGHPFGLAWWGFLIPALWIIVFGLATLLISDGLRDWLSPRTRR